MTIDEAIAHARENYNEIINTTYNKCQHEHLSCDGCANPTCKEIADENLQIAEWLEELKEIKSNGRYVQGNKAGQKIGYRNAIDDLSNKICMHFADWKYSEDDKCIKDIIELASESVEEIAEQLKEGGKG